MLVYQAIPAVGGWDVTLSVESAAVAICQSNVKDTPFDLLIFPCSSLSYHRSWRVEVLTGVAPWLEIWYTYL
jgi:hypothetical protein